MFNEPIPAKTIPRVQGRRLLKGKNHRFQQTQGPCQKKTPVPTFGNNTRDSALCSWMIFHHFAHIHHHTDIIRLWVNTCFLVIKIFQLTLQNDKSLTTHFRLIFEFRLPKRILRISIAIQTMLSTAGAKSTSGN